MTDNASRRSLRIEGVHKALRELRRAEVDDLAIDPGELVCFLGPSGCGKTTLLRIIAGLESADRGPRDRRTGATFRALPPAARDYGIVFQSYALFPNLTIRDNVAYGLVNRAPRPRRDRGARHRAPDAGRAARQRREVSGPALRRPAAAHRARARARDLARPAAARRASVGARRQGARAAARRDPAAAAAPRVTTIMVTHDQEEALSMADRVVVMNQA